MSTVAGLAILAVIFLIYLGVVYWKNKTSVVFATEKEGFVVQTPAMADEARYLREGYEPTMPGGPSTPSQAPPVREVIYQPEEGPRDPSADHYETSEMPERLRHVERSFRPAPANTETDMAMSSGLAGRPDPSQLEQSQMFNAEMAENGGEIMPGIFANDTMSPTNFSGF
jgi:hypothetical protein